MTFVKLFTRVIYSIIILNSFSLSARGKVISPLFKEIKSQVLSDVAKIHPSATINIAFNSTNRHKNYTKCEKFSLPQVKKVSSGGRLSIRLSCKQPSWSTYITLKVSIFYPIASAKMHIVKGAKFSSSNIHFTQRDITKSGKGYFKTPEPLIGKIAKRVITRSQIISPYMIDLPVLINRDDAVIIEAGVSGLTISTLGTALQSGKAGHQIRVKNNRSGIIIRAYVTGRGKVRTTLE